MESNTEFLSGPPALEIDWPLLDKGVDHILAHPEEHEQSVWLTIRGAKDTPCQTKFCLAGHLAVLAGAEVPSSKHYAEDSWHLTDSGALTEITSGDHVSTWVTQKVGLTYGQADVLFRASNTRAGIKAAVETLRAGGSLSEMEIAARTGKVYSYTRATD